ncbi:hypothetical protein F5Y12DRAFT_734309 [Xylaria sp. FL1777]|nr:hypothetical protein F5Y12DRAFT_734309 [Xylaria sp. FL1777]
MFLFWDSWFRTYNNLFPWHAGSAWLCCGICVEVWLALGSSSTMAGTTPCRRVWLRKVMWNLGRLEDAVSMLGVFLGMMRWSWMYLIWTRQTL